MFLTNSECVQDARKGVLFDSFPPVLQLQLKRFEYDFQRDIMVKVGRCGPPMPRTCSPSTTTTSITAPRMPRLSSSPCSSRCWGSNAVQKESR